MAISHWGDKLVVSVYKAWVFRYSQESLVLGPQRKPGNAGSGVSKGIGRVKRVNQQGVRGKVGGPKGVIFLLPCPFNLDCYQKVRPSLRYTSVKGSGQFLG